MEALRCSRPMCVGILELLWHATCEFAPQGDIGRFDNRGIAKLVGWKGSPDTLVDALVETRWLDPCAEHRLLVHHWSQHAPDFIKKRLDRAKLLFFLAFTPTADNGRQRQTTADNGCPPCLTQPCRTEPNRAQPRGGKGETTAPPPSDASTPTTTADTKGQDDEVGRLVSLWQGCRGKVSDGQRSAFLGAVQEAIADGTPTPLIAAMVLADGAGPPWAAPQTARDKARAVLAEFRRLVGKKDLRFADIYAIQYDPTVPDGLSKQADLDNLRQRHAAILNAASAWPPGHGSPEA